MLEEAAVLGENLSPCLLGTFGWCFGEASIVEKRLLHGVHYDVSVNGHGIGLWKTYLGMQMSGLFHHCHEHFLLGSRCRSLGNIDMR